MAKYNKYVKQAVGLIGLALIVVLFITSISSYFNTKEINLLHEGCHKVEGTSILKIHNNLTSEYSFECKK